MRSLLLIPLAALIVAAPADAKGKGGKWMDGTAVGLPKGSQLMVVKGDPSKAGDFTVHLKFPADFMVPPHSHPGDETVRVVTADPGDTVLIEPGVTAQLVSWWDPLSEE